MTRQPPSESTSTEAPEIIVRRRESPFVVRLAAWGTIIALAALIITFTLASPLFPTSANVNAMLAQSAELAIIASGLTLCLISWDFDLSVGAMATLSGITLGFV